MLISPPSPHRPRRTCAGESAIRAGRGTHTHGGTRRRSDRPGEAAETPKGERLMVIGAERSPSSTRTRSPLSAPGGREALAQQQLRACASWRSSLAATASAWTISSGSTPSSAASRKAQRGSPGRSGGSAQAQGGGREPSSARLRPTARACDQPPCTSRRSAARTRPGPRRGTASPPRCADSRGQTEARCRPLGRSVSSACPPNLT